jgi:uncharacterized protein
MRPASAAALALAGVVLLGSLTTDGELAAFFLASWPSVPFVFLCVAAYIGTERRWGRVLACLWLAALVVAGIAVDGAISALAGAPSGADGGLDAAAWRSAGLVVGLAALAALGALAVIPLGRRLYPGHEGFARRLGLVTLVAFSGVALAPLLVLGEPPILAMDRSMREAGLDPTGGRGNAGLLRDTVYGFCWTLPAALFAVGYGIRRSFRDSLARLGLAWPTGRSVAGAGVLAAVLFACSALLEPGINALWLRLGWPTTDSEGVEALFGFALSPHGAVIVAIVAGVGEEVSVRGILQPRLGVVTSNVFFTALHAYQYNWDALLSVFLFGLAFGIVRQRTSTTVSALVHAGYDLLALATLIAPSS